MGWMLDFYYNLYTLAMTEFLCGIKPEIIIWMMEKKIDG